ncbi:transposase [Bradyrhizobium japonicum]|uniref:transposase n=1 Tax=Bradyrhizobium japonicum TaxID=375 RepID=UPI0009B899CA
MHGNICGQLGDQNNFKSPCPFRLPTITRASGWRIGLSAKGLGDRPSASSQSGFAKEITFKTKPAIALEQLRWACAGGSPCGVVLMDAGYGCQATSGFDPAYCLR